MTWVIGMCAFFLDLMICCFVLRTILRRKAVAEDVRDDYLSFTSIQPPSDDIGVSTCITQEYSGFTLLNSDKQGRHRATDCR